MSKTVLTLAFVIIVLILVSGCTTPPQPIGQNSASDRAESDQKTQECNEVPMKYNQGDGTSYFKCGGVWIGSEEYQEGLDWKYDCSLTIRNMETDESGLWTVIFKLEPREGVQELERSRYIYPGESYTFEASFMIEDPYVDCETDCMPNSSYEVVPPTKLVCEK